MNELDVIYAEAKKRGWSPEKTLSFIQSRSQGQEQTDIPNSMNEKLQQKQEDPIGTTGESSSFFERVTTPTQRKNLRNATDIAIGVGKNILGTISGAAELGQRGLRAATAPITGGEQEIASIPEEITTPEGTFQTVGDVIGEIGTFAVPGAKLAKVGQVPAAASRFQKAVGLGKKILAESTLGAALTGIQEGEFGEQAKESGLITAGLTAVSPLASVPVKVFENVKKIIKPQNTDAIFRAVRPSIGKGVKKEAIEQNLDRANLEIVKQGLKPTDLKSYSDAIDVAQKNVWDRVKSFLGEGQQQNLTVNLKPISEEIKKLSADPALKRVDATTAQKVEQYADALLRGGEDVDILQAERMKQFINAQLDDKVFAGQNIAEPLKKAQKIVTKEIGKQLDSVLSQIPNEFADLKKTYGALSSIKDDVNKRLIVSSRQNPVDLFTGLGFLSGAREAIEGIAQINPLKVAKGAVEAVAGRAIKQANDPDVLVERAFEDYFKSIAEESGDDALRAFIDQAKELAPSATRRVITDQLSQNE